MVRDNCLRLSLQYISSLGWSDIKGAEVGVDIGNHALDMLDYLPGLSHLTLVDPYIDDDKKAETVMSIFKHMPTTFMRMRSVEAARFIKDHSLDFVYIDGDHSYKHVIDDLNAWLPKIRIGGVLCGHDYAGGHCPDVYNAVNDFANDKNLYLRSKIHPLHCVETLGDMDWWIQL